MTQHNLIKTDYGCYCKICQWKWRTPPTDRCPGVPRFGRWTGVPDYLKTKSELFKAGLKPRDNLGPDGCLQSAGDKFPRYWLYDERQAIPKHKPTAEVGKDVAQERAIASEAKRLWENKQTYIEKYKGALITALPLVRAKFISFKARAQISGIPGEFNHVEVETNRSSATHINAIEVTREFLDQLLKQGVPNRTLDRENLHEYLRQWGSGFIRLQDSGAGFYIRVNCEPLKLDEHKVFWDVEAPTPEPTTNLLSTYKDLLVKPNVNYWSWSSHPESRQVCPELTMLLTLPEPNSLVRQVLEALPEGKDPFFDSDKSSYSSRRSFSRFSIRGKFALRDDKYKLRTAFIDWHHVAESQLGSDMLDRIYQVVYGVPWKLIQEILTPSSGEWWEVLGVQPSASKTEVKQAYRRLVGMFHPDINKSEGAHDRAVAINRAYEQYQEQYLA